MGGAKVGLGEKFSMLAESESCHGPPKRGVRRKVWGKGGCQSCPFLWQVRQGMVHSYSIILRPLGIIVFSLEIHIFFFFVPQFRRYCRVRGGADKFQYRDF